MNILSFHSLLKEMEASKPVSSLASAVKENRFPIDIEGSEGAASGFNLLEQ